MRITEPTAPIQHRIPALDGLRGVAVLMVLVSHISSYRAEQLGPAGVAIFFVLSGYLITSLLTEEQASWGRISLAAFYARRALRLFPALLLLVLLTPFLLWAASDPRLGSIAPGLATTVLYVQDWATATGHFSVFAHAWSLSVEEQFYLLWPLALAFILRRTGRDHHRVTTIMAWSCAIAMLWHLLASLLLGYGWTYYSPDSNAIFLLTGCALATALHSGVRLHVPRPLAIAALIAVCGLPLVITRLTAVGWRGQVLLMFPVDLAGAILVLGAAKLPVLNLRLLRWFGKISYGLYLWNWVLISLQPHGRVLTARERLLAALCAIGAAAASWYLIESPILRVKRRYQRVSDPLQPAAVR